MIEEFANMTNRLIDEGKLDEAKTHFELMERLCLTGNEHTRNAIDVSYAENIMWNIDNPKKREAGWAIVPQTLKALYERQWGQFQSKNS